MLDSRGSPSKLRFTVPAPKSVLDETADYLDEVLKQHGADKNQSHLESDDDLDLIDAKEVEEEEGEESSRITRGAAKRKAAD